MNTVVITGASRGIGHATANRFLKEGWFVIGTSTTGKIDIKSPNFASFAVDYSNSDAVGKVAKEIRTKYPKINVVVNNAGMCIDAIGENIDLDVLRKTLDVNLFGTINFTETLLPAIPKDGHIINISSMAGSLSDDLAQGWIAPAYKISKTAINMYTRVLATLLQEKGITVSSLDPGWVKTDMGGDEADKSPDEAADDIFKIATSKVETGLFWLEGERRDW